MNKRIVATVVWFLTGWYASAMLAGFVGFDEAIAPFVGAAVAAFVAIDPLGLFWPPVWPPATRTEETPAPGLDARRRPDLT